MYETPNIITIDQRLLHNIQHLLIEQNKMLSDLIDSQKPKEVAPVKDACKRCGNVHENKGQELACAKKYKNGGK